jgi:hypothetical protein
MPAEPVAVDPPKHPLHALTTFELRDYRRELESAIAFYTKRHPVAPVLADLRRNLDTVLAEQDDRARLARA